MWHPYFIGVMALSLVVVGGCRKEASPAPALEPPAPAREASTSAPAGSIAEPVVERSEIAVDEPLPPFEDNSGIVLISRSVLAAQDGAAITGEIFVYEAPDGSRLLRLENLVSPKELRLDLALGREADSAPWSVGALKGPSGNMNYLLESGLDFQQVRAFLLIESGGGRVMATAPVAKP